MTGREQKTYLLFVVGPTACGKSEFAVQAAEQLRGYFEPGPEIINTDSVQFFEKVEIGAAKPSADLLKRVPHHLLGHVGLEQDYTAGSFRRDALELIQRRERVGVRGFLPVGGSGFHVRALEKGMFEVPAIDPLVRDGLITELAEKGLAALHAELAARDPETASRIAPQDRYRTLRSLEVLRSMAGGPNSNSQTLSQIRAQFEAKRAPSPFEVSFIGIYLARDVLRKRVELRTKQMLQNGLIDEVEELRRQGFAERPALQSVGYKEVQAFLEGGLSRAELEPLIVTSTMQLAKRQMTWFKKDPRITWFNMESGPEPALEAVQVFAQAMLAPRTRC